MNSLTAKHRIQIVTRVLLHPFKMKRMLFCCSIFFQHKWSPAHASYKQHSTPLTHRNQCNRMYPLQRVSDHHCLALPQPLRKKTTLHTRKRAFSLASSQHVAKILSSRPNALQACVTTLSKHSNLFPGVLFFPIKTDENKEQWGKRWWKRGGYSHQLCTPDMRSYCNALLSTGWGDTLKCPHIAGLRQTLKPYARLR